ncbi:MAG: galactokinase [Desulfatiglandales bacterium]
MPTSIRKILEKNTVTASAPCRIDAGGTWDIKAMALPLEGIGPVSVNMALDLRTWVYLSPYEEGRVRISSEGFSKREEERIDRLPFDSAFGLFFAAISYFGFHGVEIRIRSDSPVKSALGGSSTALVALIKALSKVAVLQGKKGMSGGEILHLGYHLEDGVSTGKCGIQDQAAAVYGGANRWVWRYGNRRTPFERRALMNRDDLKALSKRILVAFSGKSHVSAGINRRWITDFLSGKTRSGWIEANRIVDRFASATEHMKWNGAAALLREEMAVRREITPDALIPLTQELIDQAENRGCGARFAGAGGGGSVWAIGSEKNIRGLREIWAGTLATVRGAGVLDCAIDPQGVL